jgi:ubiquinone/menaquinone biosynthesis C-methylase UbiE
MDTTKHNVRSLFSGRAAEWAGWYAHTDAPPTLEAQNLLSRQRLALDMIGSVVRPPAQVLDVGCATGDMAARLKERGYDVSGVDIAEPMVARARERWPGIRFEVGDGEGLPFPDNSFDGVVCLGVIEYQDRDERMLQEIRRVLKPGGRAVLSTPSAVSPLYLLDQLVLAAEEALKPLYYVLKYTLRGRSIPSDPWSKPVMIRRYRHSAWTRLLRNQHLQPEDWVVRGGGWYKSRLGRLAAWLSRATLRARRVAARIAGDAAVARMSARFARHPATNWIGAEQLVRVRALKS